MIARNQNRPQKFSPQRYERQRLVTQAVAVAGGAAVSFLSVILFFLVAGSNAITMMPMAFAFGIIGPAVAFYALIRFLSGAGTSWEHMSRNIKIQHVEEKTRVQPIQLATVAYHFIATLAAAAAALATLIWVVGAGLVVRIAALVSSPVAIAVLAILVLLFWWIWRHGRPMFVAARDWFTSQGVWSYVSTTEGKHQMT